MAVHRLKTWPTPFFDVQSCTKPFEIRKDDRGYSSGDYLVLDCWSPENGYLDETPLVRKVTYLMRGGRFGVADDHVVMGIAPVDAVVFRTVLGCAPPRPPVLHVGERQEAKS